MKTQLLVTSVGEDRPGIVASITEVFVAHKANLEESRMAILGGEFAAIMLVTVAQERVAELEGALKKLETQGLSITSKSTKAGTAGGGQSVCNIELKGADHEGIVHQVSKCLRDSGVNIQSMETEIVPAPETALPLFSMHARVQIPQTVSVDKLRAQLNEIARKEAVDIKVDSYAGVA
jgi:glycine cleavage system transcriptional repressor